MKFSPEEIELALQRCRHDTDLADMLRRAATHPYYTFQPRPDRPEQYDEQTGFIASTAPISFAIGGNASGKTVAGAVKLARFCLEKQPPPRKDTPFWIISDSYDQVCGVCWFEKLRELLPPETVDWRRVRWYQEKRGWPFSVPLMPWPGRPDQNWILEFKSYEQGREKMQAASIGGAWFSEQFPWELFTEVLRGCRDYMFPGGVFCEFTPIDPIKSVEVEERYEDPPQGYAFYRLNTDLNTAVQETWRESFFATVSDEMQATRRIGAFASYEGTIYQSFNPKIHLVDDLPIPKAWWHRRASDWGASTEHPHVTLWGCKDATGRWYIYDEYWNNSQSATYLDHIAEIKDRHVWVENNPYYGTHYGDPSRPDLINLFNSQGIPTSPARNDVYGGIECVRRHLKVSPGMKEPLITINRVRCPHLAAQMRTYRWKRSSGKGINPAAAKPEPLKKDDDCVDTVRYLIFSDYPLRGSLPKPVNIERQSGRHGVHLMRPGRRREIRG